jgi:uncharacterized protein (TIGR02145 family)
MIHLFKISGYFLILFAVIFDSCKKADEVIQPDELPVITTSAVSNVQRTQAQCGGHLIAVGSSRVTEIGICWNEAGSPDLNDYITSDGLVLQPFSTNLHALNPNTTYYVRAYATNSTGTAYGSERMFTTKPVGTEPLFNANLSYGTVTDIEGNIYKTIEIGSQTWMAENLRTTRYTDNTEIDLITNDTLWGSTPSPGYCWYENNEKIFGNIYGAYYNWMAVLTSRLCPAGWHVPSDKEWKTLEMYLGMTQEQADAENNRGTTEGAQLKETGTNNWFPGGSAGTNQSGFTALPGGSRSIFYGLYYNEGQNGLFWTSTGYYPMGGVAYCRSLSYGSSGIFRYLQSLNFGLNVRCIRD